MQVRQLRTNVRHWGRGPACFWGEGELGQFRLGLFDEFVVGELALGKLVLASLH